MKTALVASLVLALAIPSLGACAKTGTVEASAPPAQKISSYKTVVVLVTSTESKNSEKNVAALRDATGAKLREAGIFSEVLGEEKKADAELALSLTIAKVDEGSQAMRAMGGGGDAEVEVSADLLDVKQGNKSIGQFKVTGNSKKDVHTSVGGLDTSAVENTTGRALAAAADQVVEYMKKNR